MGFKAAILDDGWQTDDTNRGYGYCGDWEVAEKKIKDILNKKLKDLTKEAHKVAEERDQRNISKKLKEIIYSIK